MKWISVNDRLPENETTTTTVDCLILCNGEVSFGYFYLDEDNYGTAFNYVLRGNVHPTHWTSLPEPPEDLS